MLYVQIDANGSNTMSIIASRADQKPRPACAQPAQHFQKPAGEANKHEQSQNPRQAHDGNGCLAPMATAARKRAASRASTGSIDLGALKSNKRAARRSSFVSPRPVGFVSPLIHGQKVLKVTLHSLSQSSWHASLLRSGLPSCNFRAVLLAS